MKNRTSLVLAVLATFTSCIEDYKIPDKVAESYQEELVIQGRILAGENSAIYISRTQPFGDKGNANLSIGSAEVRIIGQNGYESELAEYDQQQRQYTINTATLPKDDRYAVKVTLEGETYQSDFQELKVTPPIDEITYKESEEGISIHVSTHDEKSKKSAYMWSYEEDWEFHADIDFSHPSSGRFLYSESIYPLSDGGKNPYLYCWGHQKSSNIHIYSTENLKENVVKEHELFRIPIDDIRISYIYSILVKQWALNDEAYDYFRTLKLYTEETNGLFAPLPSEISGNIQCTSNPEIKVKGYVIAATVVEKRIFVYENDFQKINSAYSNCLRYTTTNYLNWQQAWMGSMEQGSAVIYTTSDVLDQSSILYYKECFDCRTVKGATKKRPDFWPNDHE